jgi:hypothetical protein
MKVEEVMSLNRLFHGAALVAAVSALTTPLLFADQKPDGSRTRYADAWTSGDLQTPPGSTGWGKGSIVLPVGEQTGMLVGVVTRSDGTTRYAFEAELTGCIPSTSPSGNAEFWFGGMYGKMQAVAVSETDPGKDQAPWFEVEGLWILDKHLEGTFSAQLLGRNDAGTQYVCGMVKGRFQVSDAMPGPAPGTSRDGACFKHFEDAKPIDKTKTPGTGVSDRAAEGGTITCPKGDPFAGAMPPKVPSGLGPAPGFLVTFQDANGTRRKKSGGGLYEDAPCMAGWRDAHSTAPPYHGRATPDWPVLMGSFELRYQLYE